MSYDHVYMEGIPPAKDRERLSRSDNNHNAIADALYKEGNYVPLSAGENVICDERFLCCSYSSAVAFFNSGYEAWESYIGDSEVGCGFQEVTLYRERKAVETKTMLPGTRRQGVERG